MRCCFIQHTQQLQGSGKTYTLSGNGDPHSVPSPSSNHGIVMRSLHYIFRRIQQESQHFETNVSLSFLQIYQEKIQDMLNPQSDNLALREHEDGVFVQDLSERRIRTIQEASHFISLGESNRVTALTKMNAHSSRSHSCLIINMERRPKITSQSQLDGDSRTVLKGKLYLIDLCGSERLKKTDATGVRKKEANFINASLSALGQVFRALESKKVFVPFRNSKLTRLLQDSLSGKGKSSIIVCVGPSSAHSQETNSSLLFGSRAMNVQTNAQQFKDIDYKSLSMKLQQELDEFSKKHQELEDILEEEMSESERLERKLKKKSQQLRELKDKLKQSQSERESSLGNLEREHTHTIAELQTQLEEKNDEIDELTEDRNKLQRQESVLRKQKQQLEQHIKQTTEELEEMRAKYKSMREKHDQLLVEAQQKQTDLEEYSTYSEQTISTHEKNLEKERSKYETLSKSFKQLEGRHQESSLQISSMEKKIHDLQIQNAELQVEKDSLREARAELITRAEEKDFILEELREENDRIRSDLDSNHSHNTKRVQLLEEQIGQYQEENAQLQAQLTTVQDQCRISQQNQSHAEHEVDRLNSLIGRYEQRLLYVQQQLDSVLKSIGNNGNSSPIFGEGHALPHSEPRLTQVSASSPDRIEESLQKQSNEALDEIKKKFERKKAGLMSQLLDQQEKAFRDALHDKEVQLNRALDEQSADGAPVDEYEQKRLIAQHKREIESLRQLHKIESHNQLRSVAGELTNTCEMEMNKCRADHNNRMQEYFQLREDHERQVAQISHSPEFEQFQHDVQRFMHQQLDDLRKTKDTQMEAIITLALNEDPSSMKEQVQYCTDDYHKQQQQILRQMQTKLNGFIEEKKAEACKEYSRKLKSLSLESTADHRSACTHFSTTNTLSTNISSLTEQLQMAQQEVRHTENIYASCCMEKLKLERKVEQINSTLELVQSASQNMEQSTTSAILELYAALRDIIGVEEELTTMEEENDSIAQAMGSFRKELLRPVDGNSGPTMEEEDQNLSAAAITKEFVDKLESDLPLVHNEKAQDILKEIESNCSGASTKDDQVSSTEYLRSIIHRIVPGENNLATTFTPASQLLKQLSGLIHSQKEITSSALSKVQGYSYDSLMNFVWEKNESAKTSMDTFSNIVHHLCAQVAHSQMNLRKACYHLHADKNKINILQWQVKLLVNTVQLIAEEYTRKLKETHAQLLLCADRVVEVQSASRQERAALTLQNHFRRIQYQNAVQELKEKQEQCQKEIQLKKKYIEALTRSRNALKQKRDEYKSSLREHSTKTGTLLVKQSFSELSQFFTECSSSLLGQQSASRTASAARSSTSPHSVLRRADSFAWEQSRSRASSNASIGSLDSFT